MIWLNEMSCVVRDVEVESDLFYTIIGILCKKT